MAFRKIKNLWQEKVFGSIFKETIKANTACSNTDEPFLPSVLVFRQFLQTNSSSKSRFFCYFLFIPILELLFFACFDSMYTLLARQKSIVAAEHGTAYGTVLRAICGWCL